MTTRCGYIAIVGRPNVGKSTLLNQILQQKISITSRKPQTTRHRILGIHTDGDDQFVYVDTPGIHRRGAKKIMNRLMNKSAMSVLADVDVIVFVVEGTLWREEDEFILNLIKKTKAPCFLAINKIDKISDKAQLLPQLETLQHQHDFVKMIPLSAKLGTQVTDLEAALRQFLPEGPHLFGDDQITDRPIKFLCAELLREKIFRLCGQELPYATTVEIESYQDEGQLVRIHALIMVDKDSHKQMVIGEKGQKLKAIATSARIDMEQLIGKKVFLQCWCKVKEGWSDNERLLRQLGYDN